MSEIKLSTWRNRITAAEAGIFQSFCTQGKWDVWFREKSDWETTKKNNHPEKVSPFVAINHLHEPAHGNSRIDKFPRNTEMEQTVRIGGQAELWTLHQPVWRIVDMNQNGFAFAEGMHNSIDIWNGDLIRACQCIYQCRRNRAAGKGGWKPWWKARTKRNGTNFPHVHKRADS